MTRVRWVLVLAGLGIVSGLAAPAAQAGPPAPVIGAHCGSVLDPKTKLFLFSKHPDQGCWTGSTAKAVTIDTAIRAVRAGTVALTDTIPFSQEATEQACTCLGNSVDSPTPFQTMRPDLIAVPGESMDLDHSLFGADLSAVEPTVSMAEFVANATFQHVKAVGTDDAQSDSLRLQFVKLMNQRFASLGLHKSHFANEHGGAEGLGNLPPPKSTAREMVEFWNAADDDPLFIPHLGPRVQPVTTDRPGGGHGHYTFHKWYGYYPGILGDKEGGVTPDATEFFSMLGSASRLGRTLIFDVMQNTESAGTSEFSDAANVLKFGYEKIFNPRRHGIGTGDKAKRDDAIECWDDNRCITIQRTDGNQRELTTWRIKVGQDKVESLNHATGSQTDIREVAVTQLGQHEFCPIPNHPSRRSNGCTLGDHMAVSAERNKADEITLTTWSIGAGGHLKRLSTSNSPSATQHLPARSAGLAGKGTQVALAALSPSRFIAASIQSNGVLQLDTWDVSAAGTLTRIGTAQTAVPVTSFAMTPNGSDHLITDVVTNPGGRDLINWKVADSGAITVIGTSDPPQSPDVDHLSLARISATEFMSAGETGGNALVDVWELRDDGSIVLDGDMTDIPGGANVTGTSIMPLGDHAPMLALRAGGKTQLVPMEYRTEYEHEPLGPHDDSFYALGSVTGATASQIHLGSVAATGGAAGDFVTAVINHGHLKLSNWRVG